MIPLIGALFSGGAGAMMGGAAGGAAAGGSVLSSLVQGGGIGSLISSLLGGGQQPASAVANTGADASQKTNELLGDIKGMLSELSGQNGVSQNVSINQGGAEGGHDHGAGGASRGHGRDGDDHCSGKTDDCGGKSESRSDRRSHRETDETSRCESKREQHCEGPKEHDCGDADRAETWDGKDKSPSLDRERGAARLLEQARNTDDPAEKRELIDMAMDQLGDGKEARGRFGEIVNKLDGNAYDKDIVKQADKMLDGIDDADLGDYSESKALDNVIDMLMEEGGVDGMPAANDLNGDGRTGKREDDAFPHLPMAHYHLHNALFGRH